MTLIEPALADRSRAESRAGAGTLELELSGGKTVVTRCRANSPLKLLAPRLRAHSSWVFMSSYGGGLVGGDEMSLTASLGPSTTCLLGTQSSTKIYPRRDGRGCRQWLAMNLAEGAVAVVAPDPLVCFAGATFQQRQRFTLDASAGLVLIDSLASGRRARGERWAMHHYESRNAIVVNGEQVFRDALCLDPVDGPISSRHRMGRFDCIATIVLIGPPLRAACAALFRWAETGELEAAAPGPFSASPIPGGVLLRAVGDGPESVGRWLRRILGFVPAILGDDPWARKW